MLRDEYATCIENVSRATFDPIAQSSVLHITHSSRLDVILVFFFFFISDKSNLNPLG